MGEAGGGDGDGNDGSSSRPELTRGQLLRISCGMLGLMFGWATKVVVIVMVVVVLVVVYVGNLNRQLWCCTSDGHQDRYLHFRYPSALNYAWHVLRHVRLIRMAMHDTRLKNLGRQVLSAPRPLPYPSTGPVLCPLLRHHTGILKTPHSPIPCSSSRHHPRPPCSLRRCLPRLFSVTCTVSTQPTWATFGWPALSRGW